MNAVRIAIVVLLFGATVACSIAQTTAPQEKMTVVGILLWPADPADPVHGFVSDTEHCVRTRIASAAPEIKLVSQRKIRDALFPLMEPATQPADEEAFAALLAREDVRDRLARRGLTHLIAIAGGTQTEGWRGWIGCGAGAGGGGCLGFAWEKERTNLYAAIWALDSGQMVDSETSSVTSTSIMPAFVLPVPLLAQTGAEACRDLSNRLVESIRRGGAVAR